MNREQTTLRIPQELKEMLQKEAARMGMQLNAFILMILNAEQTRHQM